MWKIDVFIRVYRYASINNTEDLIVLCEHFCPVFESYSKEAG